MYNSEKYQKTHCLKFFNQLRRRKHFPITDVAKIVTHYLSFGRTRPEQWTKDRPHIQVAALADRMSRLKVGQTDRELDVTTDHDRRRRFGDRRLASTFRPLGDRHLSRLRPSYSSRLIIGQFVSFRVSTRRVAQLPVRSVCLVHSSGRVLPNNALTNT